MAARAIGHYQWSLELHRKLMADTYRNEQISRALRKVIRKGMTLSDIGSGTGYIGFMAAKMGAQVTMYEADKEVCKLSQEIAKSNKLRNCDFIAKHSSSVHKPVQTDVVISEILGTYALEENLIETMEDAKRFLKPGGTLMPNRVHQFVAPVVSNRLTKELDAWDSVRKITNSKKMNKRRKSLSQRRFFSLDTYASSPGKYDLNFQIAKRRSFANLFQMAVTPEDLFKPESSPQIWDKINLLQRNQTTRQAKNVTWRVMEPQAFYGFCIWWEAELAPGIVLTTSPFSTPTHWQQAFAPLVTPLNAKRGDLLLVDLSSRSDPNLGGSIVTWDARIMSQGKMIRADTEPSAERRPSQKKGPPKHQSKNRTMK